jgi:hypothetical protein
MSESRYWNQVRQLVDSGYAQGRPKHEIREEITHLVQAAHADGEHWAAETLMRWERDGADDDYTRVFKDMNTTTFIRADGRRTRKTVAYSRPRRSAESGEIVGRQMQAWWGMARPAVEALRHELSAQGDRIADSVAGLDRVLAAMDRHPECATAREAWEADGRSVDEIDLGEVG